MSAARRPPPRPAWWRSAWTSAAWRPRAANGSLPAPSRPAWRWTTRRAVSQAARITAPASGTIVALDPDIPPQRQRLTLTAQGSDVRWRMDGREFARGAQAQWLPWPGRHVVQLVDRHNAVLDEIRIEVRGAGVRGDVRKFAQP
jgi:penicillin-binding protein 1C